MCPAARPPPTGLTRRQFWGVLAAALAVFALAGGPIWRDPWNIDASVFLSYLAIPPLVFGVLAVSRRFSWRDLVLDTLKVVLTKFGVTYVAAAALWAISGEPPPLPPFRPERAATRPATSPPLPRVPPSEATTLEGVVTAAGAPRAGALVWVARGAEGHSYATRTDVVELVDDGRAIVPPVAAVQLDQPLVLRSGDGRLHALRGTDEDGRTVFNVAVTSGSTRLRLRDVSGVVTLRCAVHEHAGQERSGQLVVVAHPFYTTTDPDGAFRFEGLPPGRVAVRVLDPELGQAEGEIELPSSWPLALSLAARERPTLGASTR